MIKEKPSNLSVVRTNLTKVGPIKKKSLTLLMMVDQKKPWSESSWYSRWSRRSNRRSFWKCQTSLWGFSMLISKTRLILVFRIKLTIDKIRRKVKITVKNFRKFLQLRFYVKSISTNLERILLFNSLKILKR